MREKINFNVIEITKNENITEIQKSINYIINKLMVNKFTNYRFKIDMSKK